MTDTIRRLTPEKKKLLRSWVFRIGYDKANTSLNKEHADIVLVFDSITDEKEKEEKKERLRELAEAIEYTDYLEKTNAHQLDIF